MREVIDDIARWLADGERNIALATVLTTWGSAPRKAGAKMAFTAGGAAISGSVSGGCVEGAVIEAGGEVLAGGRPCLLRFGVADETAWGVGLACGGTIEVFVERLDLPSYEAARRWIVGGTSGALLTAVVGPDALLGDKGIVERGQAVAGPLAAALDAPTLALADTTHAAQRITTAAGLELFIDPIRPAPALVIVGGAHIAVGLARLARELAWVAENDLDDMMADTWRWQAGNPNGYGE